MPVVPTYEDRGIRLDPGLNFRDNTHATPEMFGSGIGTALGGVGKGLADIGQAVSEATIAKEKARAEAAGGAKAPPDLAHVENEAAANLAVQRVAAGLVQLRNGNSETPGYGSETGTGPVDSFLRHQEDIDKFVQETRDRLTSDEQAIFDGKVASIVYDAKTQGFEAQAQARKEEIPKGFWAGARTYQDQAVEAGGDEARYQSSLALGLKEIEKLGFLQRWEPEYAEQVTAAYISDTRKRATLKIAEADPIEALKYSLDYATELTNADKMALHDAMEPGLKAAMKRESAHYSQANPAPDQFAATDLPPAAYVLLGAIGQTEASSYDARSGGGRFDDFATYPDEIGIGGASKAGRYGLDGSTWVRVAGQAGLPDFSPASQDRAAWWLARKNYNVQTGRSLEEDISAGLWNDIRKELAPTWAGLAKLSDEDFVKLMGVRAAIANGGGQTPPRGIGSDVTATGNAGVAPPIGAPVLTPTVQLPPEVEAVLARLPQARADDLRKAALAGVLESGQDRARADMVLGATRAEAYRQRIDSGDKTLTLREIDEDVVLKPDQKAELRPAWEAKNQERLETERNVQKFTVGELKLDPYSKEGFAQNDAVWDQLVSWQSPEKALPILKSLVRQTNIVPAKIVNGIQVMLASRDPEKVQGALQLAQQLMSVSNGAFRSDVDGGGVEDAAIDFRYMVTELGYSAQEASEYYIRVNDPNYRPAIDKQNIDDALLTINIDDIVRLFGMGEMAPFPIFDSDQEKEILDLYKEIYRREAGSAPYLWTAKARADEKFSRLYGVTLSMGFPVIAKYPPEAYYPDIGGSTQWMQEQLFDAVRAAVGDPTIKPGELMIEPTDDTEHRLAAGRPPAYEVFIVRKDRDGKPTRERVLSGFGFVFDPTGPLDEQNKTDAHIYAETRLAYFQARQAELRHRKIVIDQMGGKGFNTSKEAIDQELLVIDKLAEELRSSIESSTQAPSGTHTSLGRRTLWIKLYNQSGDIGNAPTAPQADPDPGFMVAIGPALRIGNSAASLLLSEENSVKGADILTPAFDPWKRAKGTIYARYPKQLATLLNEKAFNAWAAQIDQEINDERLIAASGLKGKAMVTLAGAVDIADLFPVGKIVPFSRSGYKWAVSTFGRKPARAMVAGARGAVETTIGEIAFHASQRTRSASETTSSIATEALQGIIDDTLR
ncbi:hypothetical protein [Pleomorphomonas sp. NRK KF1]|uniref:hypothetical protein n=1 Tax=Pleomorphomonas sp. NRK KF1 TaxID=2943000 RepID=UPI0020439C50|nr:hypothetical protein [Pleomorphomonas sp. NRK KF1]MCM5554020.1 hypothetical protein [Pleomorphomonas sp. NRK KF1]